MDTLRSYRNTTQKSMPIKLEPGLPSHVDSRRRHFGGLQPERHEMPTEYVDCSRSNGIEDQMLDIYNLQADTTMRLSGTKVAPEAVSCAPSKQGPEVHAARVVPHDGGKDTNGILPLPKLDSSSRQHCQGVSKKPKKRRNYRSTDVPYDSLPDYTPPISALPASNKHILQIEWHKKPHINLSHDPDRHMLHEAELELAATLGLSCAKYLCTKRRVFEAHLEALKKGRKLSYKDSKSAARIASNKAGKLYGAWTKAGLFNKQHFLKYLNEKRGTPSASREYNKGKEDTDSPSSGLTELDIWDVSESDFNPSSEGDEESTDEDVADATGSFHDRDDGIGRKHVDSYPKNSKSKQSHGSLIDKGISRERGILNDGTIDTRSSLARNETTNQVPASEGKRELLPSGKLNLENSDGLPRDDAEGRRVRETRSMTPQIRTFENSDGLPLGDAEERRVRQTRIMTRQIRTTQNNGSGDHSANLSLSKAKTNHQDLVSERPDGRSSRIPIPRSLAEADAADIMLIKMRKEGRPWPEIVEAWEKKTGQAHVAKSLLCRYNRIMKKVGRTRLKADKKTGKVCSSTKPRLGPEDERLLLAAEAEVEKNFQREKADILAEIENNFLSEKWTLVAEEMSRKGGATYSAELIQAQHEKLSKRFKNLNSKDDNKSDTSTSIQTTAALGEKPLETLTTSRHGAVRLGDVSTANVLPTNGAEHERNKVIERKPLTNQNHSEKMKAVWAKRLALGTNGHHGGPPKAATILKQARRAHINSTTPKNKPLLAPTFIHPGGPAEYSTPKPSKPTAVQPKIIQDAKQHQRSLAHIVPTTPLK